MIQSSNTAANVFSNSTESTTAKEKSRANVQHIKATNDVLYATGLFTLDMQFSKTFVAFVTLALSAVALPAEKSSGTLRVPLTKRADLIDHDGIANADFLRNHANSAAA